MGDSSKDKTGDPSMEKMYELLSRLFEQQQSKSVVSDTVKYALEPNPVKLSGPGDYVSWARHAQLILSSHGYECMLNCDEEKQKTSDAYTKQNNDRVLVWLLGSMEPTVRQQVEIMSSVSEVWKSLEKQFSGKSNKMHANRIMEELTHLKQGTKSITEYAGEARRLYRDLHYYHPFQPVDKQDLAIHHKWFEPIVAKLFLDGLNMEFNLRRQLIFSQTEWPSLDDIISSVLEEETRLSQPKEDDLKCGDNRAALSMQYRRTAKSFLKDKSKSFCDHCKRNGHTKDACFELHGYPPWWDKGKPRSGGVQGVNKRQANYITTLREPPVVDVRDLEEFKSKLKLSESSSSFQDTSKADPMIITTSHQGAKDGENLRDWDRA